MLEFIVASDAVDYGPTEDGQPFVGEVYYILAEDGDGNRWKHHHRFYGVVRQYDPEAGVVAFVDVREGAKARAELLLEKINEAGGYVDLKFWEADRPAYGSVSYQDYGCYYDLVSEYEGR